MSSDGSSILDQGGEGEIGLGLFQILIGMIEQPPAEGEAAPPPPPGGIVLINPLTRGFVVLQGEAAVALMAEISAPGFGHQGPPPASKASIEDLRSVDAGEVGDDECPVCLDRLGGDKTAKEMPCRHRFHGVCIEKWLAMHGSCPICRFQMPVEDEEGTKKIGDEEGVRRRVVELMISLSFPLIGNMGGEDPMEEDGNMAEDPMEED